MLLARDGHHRSVMIPCDLGVPTPGMARPQMPIQPAQVHTRQKLRTGSFTCPQIFPFLVICHWVASALCNLCAPGLFRLSP